MTFAPSTCRDGLRYLESALSSVGWSTADEKAALAWANRLPSNDRDKAIYAGAGGLVENQPALAAAWTMTIQNESLRVQQTERVARRWLKTDRWAAENWIRQSVLPLETKNRLVGLFPGNF
jgi:hypothetical protein